MPAAPHEQPGMFQKVLHFVNRHITKPVKGNAKHVKLRVYILATHAQSVAMHKIEINVNLMMSHYLRIYCVLFTHVFRILSNANTCCTSHLLCTLAV